MNDVEEANSPQNLTLSEQQQNPQVDVLRNETDWFVEVADVNGEKRYYRRGKVGTELRANIVEGTHPQASAVTVYAKGQDGKWVEVKATLLEFARRNFPLRVLYEPIWAHAMAGLKWGAWVGIALKLLDTLIFLGSVDPCLAIIFLVAIVVCCIPRLGIVALILVAIPMRQVTNMNPFIMVVAAGLVGAALGCLPGMAIGGVIGLWRKTFLSHAGDATPEPGGMFFKTVALPLAGGCTLLAFYLFVFNPWVATKLAESADRSMQQSATSQDGIGETRHLSYSDSEDQALGSHEFPRRCADCGCFLRASHSVSSNFGPILCPRCGADVRAQRIVFDLRKR